MQSVMMDENSLVVAYDIKRGEPRRGNTNIESKSEGDCINCYNCVKVCPTGIDIRRGTQLECIACTNCIDACDEIMVKINKPKGLIRYASENEALGLKRRIITPRSILYAAFAIFFAITFILFLKHSTDLKLIFLRGNAPYSLNADQITNQFTLKFSHQGHKIHNIFLKLKDEKLLSQVSIITPVSPIKLKLHESKVIVFFKFNPKVLHAGSRKIEVDVIDYETKHLIMTEEVNLVGPTN
jgi:cytochrome c oxidase accessory protein FixG